MLGAAGALCCLAAGTALGGWMRLRRMERLHMLKAEMDVLNAMRMMLEQERPALPELLEMCAEHARGGESAELLKERLRITASGLRSDPLAGAAECYALACAQIPAAWEKQEEKNVMESLFAQIGTGTASMREQASASCIRKLKPLCDRAQAEAERGGRLCIQLGMLLGLMAGIILW